MNRDNKEKYHNYDKSSESPLTCKLCDIQICTSSSETDLKVEERAKAEQDFQSLLFVWPFQ